MGRLSFQLFEAVAFQPGATITLRGGDGNDTLIGGFGNDQLEGGEGNDLLEGREGDGHLFGDGDDDILRGGAGDGSFTGGEGDDVLIGGGGMDVAMNVEGDTVDFAGLDWPTPDLTTSESGDTASLEVVLLTQPTADVMVRYSTSDQSEAIVLDGPLVFTTRNWNVPQHVTVQRVDDRVADGDTDEFADSQTQHRRTKLHDSVFTALAEDGALLLIDLA